MYSPLPFRWTPGNGKRHATREPAEDGGGAEALCGEGITASFDEIAWFWSTLRPVRRTRPRARVGSPARFDHHRSAQGEVNAQLGRKLQAAMIAINATARNVEVDRDEPDEREVLARVCDELARALRTGNAPDSIDGAIAETPSRP